MKTVASTKAAPPNTRAGRRCSGGRSEEELAAPATGGFVGAVMRVSYATGRPGDGSSPSRRGSAGIH